MKDSMTVGELLEHLQGCSIISQEQMDTILNKYGTDESEIKDPLYIRILSGIGAWSAAIFLIMFLGLAHLIEHESSALIIGVMFFYGAILVAKKSRATFLSQFSLALAFSGNILILFGASDTYRSVSLSKLVIVQAIICGVAYPLFRNNIYRYLSPIALVILATAWIIEKQAFYSMNVLVTAEMILFGELILQRKRHAELVPLVYSAATMLPATLLFMNLTQIHLWKIKFQVPLWPSSVLLSAGLIYLFINLAGGLNRLREPWLILATCSTILLGIFTTPGILVAIGLLVIGYAYGDRLLSGISYIFLPCFLVLFYYALNVNLAYESYVLAGSGFILLILWWLTNYFQPEKEVI